MNSAGAILVVDNDANMCKSIAVVLEDYGYAVEAVGTAAQAIARCRNNGIKVVLLDVRLPDADGLDVLKELRAEFPSLRVMVMTAYANEEIEQAAADYNADAFLTKPFDLEQVVKRMQSWQLPTTTDNGGKAHPNRNRF